MRIDDIKNIYFVGIGGIGMSALARYFNIIGKNVAGYDKTETELTRKLEEEGIDVSYADSADMILVPFREQHNTVTVKTPAIPAENVILRWFEKNRFKIFKRSEVLGYISRELDSMCIAGTHGKTSITTMLSFLLNEYEGCNAFLGGISVNYQSNLVLNAKSRDVVIEADEYDRSFHHLRPDVALITAVDADHLDIYGDESTIHQSFEDFIRLIKHEGTLIIHKDLEIARKITLDRSYYTYSFDDKSADFYGENIRQKDGKYIFDFNCPRHRIRDVEMGIPGKLNAENMIAAIAVACLKGMTDEAVLKNVPEFKGVKRRFQTHYNDGQRVFIDDYAHHPVEIRRTLDSVKGIWPDREITAVFQPHLYSRTKDFYTEFAKALDMADRVYLLDIYPARELPMEGVTSELIANAMTKASVKVYSRTALLYELSENKPEVLITMGAGDIDLMIPNIKEKLYNA